MLFRSDEVFGCLLSDGRADTLCVNALLPLLQDARHSFDRSWLDWPPGHHPDDLHDARALLGFAGPARNWEIQGILDVLRRTAADAAPA